MRENSLLEMPCFELQHAVQTAELAGRHTPVSTEPVVHQRETDGASPCLEPLDFLY
jgi:hypothetical protein